MSESRVTPRQWRSVEAPGQCAVAWTVADTGDGLVDVEAPMFLSPTMARALCLSIDTAARMAESESVVQRQHQERLAELNLLVKEREAAGDLDGARAALWDLHKLQQSRMTTP